MSDDNKNLANIRNLLGFLLAGFGAILTFLGIQSSEVSTILRNDSPQASLIALILLFGILAAVSAIVTGSKKKISLASAAAIGVTVFGVGALVIFAIPIEPNPFSFAGTASLVIGCVLVLAGTAALVHFRPFWVEEGMAASNTEEGRLRQLWLKSAAWQVNLIDILILVSVLLTAIAAYGAMRLETKSQLSFSSQVGASFSVDGSSTTVSLDIAAAKIPQSDWLFVDVYALPTQVSLASICAHFGPTGSVRCMGDPCVFAQNPNGSNVCNVLLNGAIVPNAAGNVDETIKVPFLTSRYQVVDVRAYVCAPNANGVCVTLSSTPNYSRLDWIVSNSLISSANLRPQISRRTSNGLAPSRRT
jgi:hypothetical protein